MKRREFITLLGGAAVAWPRTAQAQQPAIPVIGLLSPESATTGNINGLHEGLRELGYVEGQTIPVASSWRTPSSQPRASAHSRASVCGLRDTRPASKTMACPRARRRT